MRGFGGGGGRHGQQNSRPKRNAMPSNHVLPLIGGPPPAYEARRKRTEWPESVRADEEVKALDESNGEWILCRTCADHYERTRRGRKPNDPEGFKVRMNGRFQEAAWLMHKSRVVAHRAVLGGFAGHGAGEEDEEYGGGLDAAMERSSKRQKTSTSGSDSDEPTACEAGGAGGGNGAGFFSEDHPRTKDMGNSPEAMHIPRTGWRCPGIVPDYFYQAHADLVHAFSKYYVGNYRVNVVRDIRSDKVMLFAHDCENRVVQRDRPTQPISCNKCYGIWLHNKSFKRILKKMDRYNQVEAILRHSWSLSAEDLSVLSKFKHASGMNLSSEGRQLKQAAMTVLKQFNDAKSIALVSHAPARVMQLPPSAAELMLSDSSSFDSGMHDPVGSDDAGPAFDHDDEVVVVVGGPRSHHHTFQSLSSGQPRYERQV